MLVAPVSALIPVCDDRLIEKVDILSRKVVVAELGKEGGGAINVFASPPCCTELEDSDNHCEPCSFN